MNYSSLEQRIVGAYLAMMPKFVPADQSEVSIAEQREFYDLMKNLYQLVFDNPLLVVPTVHEDDAFPNRYKTGYGKPVLQDRVLKCKKAVNSLLKNMFLIGQGESVQFNKRQLNTLSALGINGASNLPVAWTWMSRRPEANEVSFAYCLFNQDHVYASDIYAPLLGETAFRRLEEWMLLQGYKAYDLYNTTWVDYRLTLTYANPAWGEECPNRGFEYKIRHTGISAQYDAYLRNPACLGLCIPYGLKSYLENFDSMSQKVKDFVIEHTRRCNGCNYCIQTDKKGIRPLARIPIVHGQASYNLCPYFPGYNYCWSSVDDNLVDNIIAFLSFMDDYADDFRKQ